MGSQNNSNTFELINLSYSINNILVLISTQKNKKAPQCGAFNQSLIYVIKTVLVYGIISNTVVPSASPSSL